jgi:hypothetical protein
MNLLAAFLSSFAAEQRTNIILIYTDNHGHANLGIHGVMKDIKSPHLDALASLGPSAVHRLSFGPVRSARPIPIESPARR